MSSTALTRPSASALPDLEGLGGQTGRSPHRSRPAGVPLFETSSVRVGQQQLHVGYHRAKSGGIPLLMFNGIGANLELLAPLASQINRRDVLAFDVPGVGRSPEPAWPYRLPGLARLVAGVLDHLGLESVDVFGVSWGGVAAQQFVRSYRTRARRLVLCATSPGTLMVPPHPAVALRMMSPLRYVNREYAQEFAGDIYGGDFRRGMADIAGHFEQLNWQSRRGYYMQLLAAAGWTSLHWLHRIRQPTLILAGSEDRLVSTANARLMHALIPCSRLQMYDCGHLFIMTRAAEVARDIERFLDGDFPPK